jgi:hypothetical protein
MAEFSLEESVKHLGIQLIAQTTKDIRYLCITIRLITFTLAL